MGDHGGLAVVGEDLDQVLVDERAQREVFDVFERKRRVRCVVCSLFGQTGVASNGIFAHNNPAAPSRASPGGHRIRLVAGAIRPVAQRIQQRNLSRRGACRLPLFPFDLKRSLRDISGIGSVAISLQQLRWN